MRVKELLEIKKAQLEEAKEQERLALLSQAEKERDALIEVIQHVEKALDGMDFTELGYGEYKVRYKRNDIFVQVKWYKYDKPAYNRIMVHISMDDMNSSYSSSLPENFVDIFSDFLLKLT